VGNVYGWVVRRRFEADTAYRASLPVICIGNFTAGGTGKTPVALHVAEYLIGKRERPVFLSRGYGGSIVGPHWVDPATDGAGDVGDEPLLLARTAPTMIARNRALGAKAIEAASTAVFGGGFSQGDGAPSVIIMDDGLQNPALMKDLTIAVVDAKRGLGNGQVIPAGPLRAALAFQLALADAVIVNRPARAPEGDGTKLTDVSRGDVEKRDIETRLRTQFSGPVIGAQTGPAGDIGWLQDLRVMAFAGIGAPQRFFDLLKQLGADLAGTRVFADHHAFTATDARELVAMAQAADAQLVTTEKDFVRLARDQTLAELMQLSRALPIQLTFADDQAARLAALLDAVLAGKARSTRAAFR
jgi:tetraacyldisaccharide 4'-kinase